MGSAVGQPWFNFAVPLNFAIATSEAHTRHFVVALAVKTNTSGSRSWPACLPFASAATATVRAVPFGYRVACVFARGHSCRVVWTRPAI